MTDKKNKVLPDRECHVAVHCAHSSMADPQTLKPNPRNPNKHPKAQIELLAKIIKASGWRNPIVVSKLSGFVVKGHGRLQAALLLGVSEVPVDFQEYSSAEVEWADCIADNRIAELAETDAEILKEIIGKLSAQEFDMDLTGYSPMEFERLMTQLSIGNMQGEPANPDEQYNGMPDFENKKVAYKTLLVHFEKEKDLEAFAKLVKQSVIKTTRYIWFPFKENADWSKIKCGENPKA